MKIHQTRDTLILKSDKTKPTRRMTGTKAIYGYKWPVMRSVHRGKNLPANCNIYKSNLNQMHYLNDLHHPNISLFDLMSVTCPFPV